MTCIVGLVDNDKVYIGGDSAGVAGWDLTVRADQKVFKNGPMAFGFCGSFRMGQLLHHAFVMPDHDPRTDLNKYMVTTFVDAVRQCLKNGGYATMKDGAESGGIFLVGYKGRLFKIEADYQVAEGVDEFLAAGCGDSFALGVLHATKGQPPEERIRLALEAAERFSAGVRGPFVTEVI